MLGSSRVWERALIGIDTVLPVKRWMLILAALDLTESVGVLAKVKDKAHCVRWPAALLDHRRARRLTY